MRPPEILRRVVHRSPRLYGWWRRARRSRLPRGRRSAMPGAGALRRHARAALRGDPSYAGEGAHLIRLLELLGIERGFIVDIAAGDGVTQSPTLPLFRERGSWTGLAVEADPTRFAMLAYAYAPFTDVRLARMRVTPDNVVAALRGHGVPGDFTILNLDIDSYDLAVAEALLGGYEPALITLEINEKIPPPLDFEVLYRPDHVWREDHFYGCSIVAACRALKPRGYLLESLEFNNAFFVRRDVAAGRIEDRGAGEAYERGYLLRPERREMFPWNADMEDLSTCSPAAAAERIRERFSAYEGAYRLEMEASVRSPVEEKR